MPRAKRHRARQPGPFDLSEERGGIRAPTDVARVETVGLDLRKRWLHVHGVNGRGKTCVNCRLPRSRVEGFFVSLPRGRASRELCGGAHRWKRRLTSMGHEVRLIPVQRVQSYVKSNQNEAADSKAAGELAASVPCRGSSGPGQPALNAGTDPRGSPYRALRHPLFPAGTGARPHHAGSLGPLAGSGGERRRRMIPPLPPLRPDQRPRDPDHFA